MTSDRVALEDYVDDAIAGVTGFQPVDSDLTAIAALTTTSYGRAFLALADPAAGRTALGLGTSATHATGDYDTAGAAAAAQAASQPLDSDLTAIAALTTTSFGRSVLAAADAAALRTLAATVIGTNVQAWDADLDSLAAVGLTAAGLALLDDANAAAQRTTLGLGTAATSASTDFQPIDSDLTAIAALTTTSFGRGLLAAANAAALGIAASDVGAQPVDADLTTIAGLTATTDNVIQSVAGAWASRTPAQVKATLALAKGDVGLGNVDNTADTAKPVSTAQQTALDLKAPTADPTFTGITTSPAFAASGLTGATSASRDVGGTVSGAPVSGTFAKGDRVTAQDGALWICTTAGSPGTWAGLPNNGALAFLYQPLDADLTALAQGGWPLIPPKISGQLNIDRTLYQQSPTPGAATRVVVGMAAGPANAGTVTSGDDADGPWQLLTTAASSNAEATMYTATMFRRDWGAIAFGSMKTPSSVAVGAFYAGFTSAALGNNAIPATHCALFRYRVGTDGTAFWRTNTNNAGTGTAQTTSVAVAVSTVYRWAIRLLASSVEYYLATADGALTLVATETSTLPTATTALAVLTRVQSTDSTATAMQWGRHTILMKP